MPYPVEIISPGTNCAASLAATLLGAPSFQVRWGGRTRLVSAAIGMRSRYGSVRWAPAYRSRAKLMRELIAIRAAVQPNASNCRTAVYRDWPPESMRHLRAVDAIVGTPGPRQSILVRFVDPESGIPCAVVKLMVSQMCSSGSPVKTESEALQDARVSSVAPRFLESGTVDGRDYLVTEYVEGNSPSTKFKEYQTVIRALKYQEDLRDHVAIREHPWVSRAIRRVPVLRPDSLSGFFAITRTHGDFAPWNLLVRRTGEVSLIDWEFSEPDGVAGMDFAHYLLATQRLLRRRGPLATVRRSEIALQRYGGYSYEQSRTLITLAALSVLSREAGLDHSDDQQFWKQVIVNCQR